MSFQIESPNYFPNPSLFGATGLGYLYLGVVNGEPATVPADRIQAYIVRQGLANLPISQPISIGAGGVPMYNGAPVQIEVTAEYSIQVMNSAGSQVYYSASAGKTGAAIDSINTQISAIYTELSHRSETVATVAALRTMKPDYVGQQFDLLGYTAPGVGGGHVYYAGIVANSSSDDSLLTFVSFVDGVYYQFKRINYLAIDITMAGAIPDGVTDNTAAINICIAYANARGGIDASNVVGTTILIPDGRYLINSALTAVTKSAINFVGQSKNGTVLLLKNGTTTFTWGDGVNTCVGGGVSNCKIEYLTAPSGATIAFRFNYAFRQTFDNLMFVNAGTIASLGVSSSALTGGISFSNIDGFVHNGGRPAFDLRYGAGLYINNAHLFVGGVGNPTLASFTATTATNVMTVTSITGTPIVLGQYVHGVGIAPGTVISSFGTGTGGTGTYNLSTSPGTLSSRTLYVSGNMTTIAGTILMDCKVGFWDTVQMTNCIFERFDIPFNIVAGSGMVYQNFFFSNVVVDYCRRFCVYAESQAGGVIAGMAFSKDCWYSCWENDAIYLIGSGFHDNHAFDGTITIAGIRGVYYTLQNAKNINLSGLQVNAVNRKGVAAAALEFGAGAKGFTMIGVKGNFDVTGQGFPWRAGYGVQLLADCDNFTIQGCTLDGFSGGYNVNPVNSAGSGNRKICNNLNANYAVNIVTAIPATAVTYTNTSAMVEDWSFFGGTITTGYAKNGVGFPGALQYLNMRLQPGDTYSVGYSVAPSAKIFVEP